MKKILLGVFITLLVSASTSFAQGSLSVVIKDIQTRKGTIYVSLCDSKTFEAKGTKVLLTAVPKEGNAKVVFNNLPIGQYAIRVFQDVNNDKTLNMGVMSIPKEPFGFSNNPSMMFGPPSFDKANFSLKNKDSKIIEVKLMSFEF